MCVWETEFVPDWVSGSVIRWNQIKNFQFDLILYLYLYRLFDKILLIHLTLIIINCLKELSIFIESPHKCLHSDDWYHFHWWLMVIEYLRFIISYPILSYYFSDQCSYIYYLMNVFFFSNITHFHFTGLILILLYFFF